MIPSLLQIPSAVSDSKLHSVLPNNGKGDFTFDRSTGATRINRDGLIEEVGYFSSELVQNGNFSELGSELVTNGDFATDSNWTKGTGWTISGGTANFNGGSGFSLYAGQNYVNGKTYKISYDVLNYVSGGVRISFDGQVSQTISSNSTNNTFYHTYNGGNTNIFIQSVGASQFSIDNVSVKQVDPNDRWTLGTGWSFGDNKIIGTNVAGYTSISQSAAISNSNGKTFKVKFTISDYSSGQVALYISGFLNNSFFISANGSYDYNITVSSGTSGNVEFLGNNNFTGAISNVSVVEVQGDRPRLSYDITNGVVEDKPHLLLEPSATNFATFSEDFSQSVWLKTRATITTNQITSPDGTLSASFQAETTDNNSHFVFFNYTTSVASYTFSVFVKYKNRQYVQFTKGGGASGYANFDILNGTTANFGGAYTSTKIENYGNGWYRCSGTFTGASEAMNFGVCNILTNVSSRFENYTGDVNSGFYIWGAMFEQQSYATSYIPTAGTTITRAAETCDKTGLSGSIGQTEGVLYGEFNFKDHSTGTRRLLCLTDGSTSNRITTYVDSNDKLSVFIVNGGSTQADIRATTLTEGVIKYALLYANNNIKLYLNGTQIGTDTSATIPATSDLYIGSENGNSPSYFNWKGVALYTNTLSESQLMQLTGVTASSIYSNFVTRTASFTVEALNEVKKVIDNL